MQIPRLLVRPAALRELLLAPYESESDTVNANRDGVKDLTTKVKAAQQTMTTGLHRLDRIVRLFGRHLLLQSYTNHFLRDPITKERVTQERKPSLTGLSTTVYPLTEKNWVLATPASIAEARAEGSHKDSATRTICYHSYATQCISPPLPI
jgi:hypothetical protein